MPPYGIKLDEFPADDYFGMKFAEECSEEERTKVTQSH